MAARVESGDTSAMLGTGHQTPASLQTGVRSKTRRARPHKTYVGIDGEGQGRDPHRYVLLAACDESGQFQRYVENFEGLTTLQCLDFLTSLPREIKAFGYALNYDWTKILQDLPDWALYYLFRPELRPSKREDSFAPTPVLWKGYALNLQGTKFTIRRRYKDGKRIQSKAFVVWDIFKFFQAKFVGAIEEWKVGDRELWDRMSHMKDKRSDFDKESPDQVREYCFSECRSMAQLARKLTDAHVAAGINLKNYFGAGSSASGILDTMGIKEKIKNQIPYSIIKEPKYQTSMDVAVMSAFFGGRFENTWIGEIPETVFSYDISSAYPYQICLLPCLEHGRWEFTTDRADLDNARAALVQWHLSEQSDSRLWGPLPFRTREGFIVFPLSGGNGWTYLSEFLVAERDFGNVDFTSAWVLRQDCNCVPFPDMARYYCERCRIGKEGPGIVIKLGCNSCYGKLAQSVGKPQYRCMLWAGMITSGCRSQLLDTLRYHKDPNNLLAVATDGVYSRERLVLPKPIDTGTAHTGKPLGGWEEKIIEGGMFMARPGINFPLNPKESEIKTIRGRGFGRKTIFENAQIIKTSWANIDHSKPLTDQKVSFPNVSRFCGAKSSIHQSMDPETLEHRYTRANGETHRYGEWVEKSMVMSFDPRPKRPSIEGNRLAGWKIRPDALSAPYKALPSDEENIYHEFEQIQEEQPD